MQGLLRQPTSGLSRSSGLNRLEGTDPKVTVRATMEEMSAAALRRRLLSFAAVGATSAPTQDALRDHNESLKRSAREAKALVKDKGVLGELARSEDDWVASSDKIRFRSGDTRVHPFARRSAASACCPQGACVRSVSSACGGSTEAH